MYGEGASVSSAGVMAKQGGPTSDAYADIEDVLEYLHFSSSKGDIKATFGLALRGCLYSLRLNRFPPPALPPAPRPSACGWEKNVCVCTPQDHGESGAPDSGSAEIRWAYPGSKGTQCRLGVYHVWLIGNEYYTIKY